MKKNKRQSKLGSNVTKCRPLVACNSELKLANAEKEKSSYFERVSEAALSTPAGYDLSQNSSEISSAEEVLTQVKVICIRGGSHDTEHNSVLKENPKMENSLDEQSERNKSNLKANKKADYINSKKKKVEKLPKIANNRTWFHVVRPKGIYRNGRRLRKNPGYSITDVLVLKTAISEMEGIECERLVLWNMSADDTEELKRQVKQEAMHKKRENIMPLSMKMTKDQIETAYQGIVQQWSTCDIEPFDDHDNESDSEQALWGLVNKEEEETEETSDILYEKGVQKSDIFKGELDSGNSCRDALEQCFSLCQNRLNTVKLESAEHNFPAVMSLQDNFEISKEKPDLLTDIEQTCGMCADSVLFSSQSLSGDMGLKDSLQENCDQFQKKDDILPVHTTICLRTETMNSEHQDPNIDQLSSEDGCESFENKKSHQVINEAMQHEDEQHMTSHTDFFDKDNLKNHTVISQIMQTSTNNNLVVITDNEKSEIYVETSSTGVHCNQVKRKLQASVTQRGKRPKLDKNDASCAGSHESLYKNDESEIKDKVNHEDVSLDLRLKEENNKLTNSKLSSKHVASPKSDKDVAVSPHKKGDTSNTSEFGLKENKDLVKKISGVPDICSLLNPKSSRTAHRPELSHRRSFFNKCSSDCLSGDESVDCTRITCNENTEICLTSKNHVIDVEMLPKSFQEEIEKTTPQSKDCTNHSKENNKMKNKSKKLCADHSEAENSSSQDDANNQGVFGNDELDIQTLNNLDEQHVCASNNKNSFEICQVLPEESPHSSSGILGKVEAAGENNQNKSETLCMHLNENWVEDITDCIKEGEGSECTPVLENDSGSVLAVVTEFVNADAADLSGSDVSSSKQRILWKTVINEVVKRQKSDNSVCRETEFSLAEDKSPIFRKVPKSCTVNRTSTSRLTYKTSRRKITKRYQSNLNNQALRDLQAQSQNTIHRRILCSENSDSRIKHKRNSKCNSKTKFGQLAQSKHKMSKHKHGLYVIYEDGRNNRPKVKAGFMQMEQKMISTCERLVSKESNHEKPDRRQHSIEHNTKVHDIDVDEVAFNAIALTEPDSKLIESKAEHNACSKENTVHLSTHVLPWRHLSNDQTYELPSADLSESVKVSTLKSDDKEENHAELNIDESLTDPLLYQALVSKQIDLNTLHDNMTTKTLLSDSVLLIKADGSQLESSGYGSTDDCSRSNSDHLKLKSIHSLFINNSDSLNSELLECFNILSNVDTFGSDSFNIKEISPIHSPSPCSGGSPIPYADDSSLCINDELSKSQTPAVIPLTVVDPSLNQLLEQLHDFQLLQLAGNQCNSLVS